MKKTWLILPFISFFLSLIGIWHALPMHVVGDEEALIGGALKMLELKTLIPSLYPVEFSFLYYLPVIPYLILMGIAPIVLIKFVVLNFSIPATQEYFTLNQDAIWICARVLSGLSAAGIVAVIFHIAKRLFNEKAAWMSSLLLVFSFFHVLLSHWVRHWTFTTFFCYLAVLYGVLYVQKKEVRYAIGAAIAGALGFGVIYLGALGFFFVLVYWWFERKHLRFISATSVAIGVFGTLAIVFTLLNIHELFRIISPIDGSLSNPKSISGFVGMLGYIGTTLLKQEIVISILALCGLLTVRKYWKMSGAIVVSLIAYVALLYGAFHIELRYVYLTIPMLCLVAGMFIAEISVRVPYRWLKIGVGLFIAIWPIACLMRYEYLLLQSDTREQAIEWIGQSTRPGTSFMLSSETMILPRTVESIIKDQEMGRVRAAERYKVKKQKSEMKNQENEFDYYNIHFWREGLTEEEVDVFMNNEQPEYFIVDYWSKEGLTDRERGLMERGTLIQRFKQSELEVNHDINGNFYAFNNTLFKLHRFGPTVDVYRL